MCSIKCDIKPDLSIVFSDVDRCFETLYPNAKTINYTTTLRRLEATAICQITDS